MRSDTTEIPDSPAQQFYDSVLAKTKDEEQAYRATKQRFGPPASGDIAMPPAQRAADPQRARPPVPDYGIGSSILNGLTGGLLPYLKAGVQTVQTAATDPMRVAMQPGSLGGVFQQEAANNLTQQELYHDQRTAKDIGGNILGAVLGSKFLLPKGVLGSVPGVRNVVAAPWSAAKPAVSSGIAGVVARTTARMAEGGVQAALATGAQSVAGQATFTGDVDAGKTLADMQRGAVAGAAAAAVFGPILERIGNGYARSKLANALNERFGVEKPSVSKSSANRLLYDATREAGYDLADPAVIVAMRNAAMTPDDQLTTFMDVVAANANTRATPGGEAVPVRDLVRAAGSGSPAIRQSFNRFLTQRNGGYRDTGERIVGFLKQTFGPSQSAKTLEQTIEGQRSALGAMYDQARQQGVQITDPRITEILRDPRTQESFLSLRKVRLAQRAQAGGTAKDLATANAIMAGKASLPDTYSLEDLHLLRQAMDDVIHSGIMPNADVALRNEVALLRDRRAILTEAMNEAAPAFAPANRLYAQYSEHLESLKLAEGAAGRSNDQIVSEMTGLSDGGKRLYAARFFRELDDLMAKRRGKVVDLFTPDMEARVQTVLQLTPALSGPNPATGAAPTTAMDDFLQLIQSERAKMSANKAFQIPSGAGLNARPGVAGFGEKVRAVGYGLSGNLFFSSSAILQAASQGMAKGLLSREADEIAGLATSPFLDVVRSLTRAKLPTASIRGAAAIPVAAPVGTQYRP